MKPPVTSSRLTEVGDSSSLKKHLAMGKVSPAGAPGAGGRGAGSVGKRIPVPKSTLACNGTASPEFKWMRVTNKMATFKKRDQLTNRERQRQVIAANAAKIAAQREREGTSQRTCRRTRYLLEGNTHCTKMQPIKGTRITVTNHPCARPHSRFAAAAEP